MFDAKPNHSDIIGTVPKISTQTMQAIMLHLVPCSIFSNGAVPVEYRKW